MRSMELCINTFREESSTSILYVVCFFVNHSFSTAKSPFRAQKLKWRDSFLNTLVPILYARHASAPRGHPSSPFLSSSFHPNGNTFCNCNGAKQVDTLCRRAITRCVMEQVHPTRAKPSTLAGSKGSAQGGEVVVAHSLLREHYLCVLWALGYHALAVHHLTRCVVAG